MTTFLQLLSLDTVSCSPSVIVVTESSRFLFDSGEGIQRLCVEHRARIAKLEGVYLTRLSPETVSGLPGLCLTAADAGRTHLAVVGPKDTTLFWDSTSHFMRRNSFEVSISEPVVNESSSTMFVAAQKYSEMTIHSIPLGQTHLCYICETPQLAGKFDVSKAIALKIPKGPMFAKLKGGHSVVLSDGTEIRPDQVVDEAVPGRFISIICSIEVENQAVLDDLSTQQMFKRFHRGGDLEGRMDCMVHLSPHDMVSSSSYKKWMELFTNTTVHIAAGRGICMEQSSFIAATRQSIKQHLICPDFFTPLTIESDSTHLVPDDDSFCRIHYDVDLDVDVGMPVHGCSAASIALEQNEEHLPLDSTNLRRNLKDGTKTSMYRVSVLRGSALMKYNLLPTRRRGLEPSDLLMRVEVTAPKGIGETARKGIGLTALKGIEETALKGMGETAVEELNSFSLVSDHAVRLSLTRPFLTGGEGSSEIASIAQMKTAATPASTSVEQKLELNESENERKYSRSCTPSDSLLIEFWDKLRDNKIINDSLEFTSEVRRKADIIEISNNEPSAYAIRKFGSYGYPTVSNFIPSHYFKGEGNNVNGHIDIKNSVDAIALEIEDSHNAMNAEENIVQIEIEKKFEEKKRIEENYNFYHPQADLLKLSGSLGGSISFLGTACAIPSKYRNVSGILLHLPIPITNSSSELKSHDPTLHGSKNSNNSNNSSSSSSSSSSSCSRSGYYNVGQSTMLLDAGEGTWQQMVRMAYHTPSLVTPNSSYHTTSTSTSNDKSYGTLNSVPDPEPGLAPKILEKSQENGILHRNDDIPDSMETILARDLKVIWISHPHADHHLGLLMILSERKRLLTARCTMRKENSRKVMKKSISENKDVVDDILVNEESEMDSDSDRNDFHPVLLIAPPSVLSFLRDYCALDNRGLVRGSYIPVSSRQFDRRDNCKNGDSYWQDTINGHSDALVGADDIKTTNESSYPFSCAENIEKTAIGISTDPAYDSYQSSFSTWQTTSRENLLLAKKILSEVGIVDLENVKVIHCPQAYGLVMQLSTTTQDLNMDMKLPSNKLITPTVHSTSNDVDPDLDTRTSYSQCGKKLKIVYSGDTRPSPLLTALGRDCTILIHEATFEDDEAGLENASLKRHCTVGEAVQVGRDMNAYRLILTHFSQRYPSVPALPLGALDYALLAFDFMRVPFQDLLWAPAIMPALIEAFPPGGNEIDDELDPLGDDNSCIEMSTKAFKASENRKRKANCRCHEWPGDIVPAENNMSSSVDIVLDSSSEFGLRLKLVQCNVCAPVEGKKKKDGQKTKNKKVDITKDDL